MVCGKVGSSRHCCIAFMWMILTFDLAQTGVGCFVGGFCFNNLSYADDLVILDLTVAALNHLLSIM